MLDNLRRGAIGNLAPHSDQVKFVAADVRDRQILQEALRDVDLVFHLAAQSNVIGAATDIEYSFSSNVVGTFNVLQAARINRVKRLVFTSSREIYGDQQILPVPETAALRPKNLYGASKAAGEMYCHTLGAEDFETTVLRLANVYGPGDRDRVIPIFVENALNGRPLTLFGGEQVLDFVWIETVVDALMQCGLGKFVDGPVNIGSGNGTGISQLAQRVLEATKSPSPIEVAPGRAVEVSQFVADISRATKLFGIEPPGDPLYRLKDVIEAARGEMKPEG